MLDQIRAVQTCIGHPLEEAGHGERVLLYEVRAARGLDLWTGRRLEEEDVKEHVLMV